MEIFWCISDSKSVSALSSVFGASLIPKPVSALSSVKFAIGEYIDIDNWCVSELKCFLPFKPHSFGLPVYHGMNVDEYSTKIPPFFPVLMNCGLEESYCGWNLSKRGRL